MRSDQPESLSEFRSRMLREGDTEIVTDIIGDIETSLEYARLRCYSIEILIEQATEVNHPAHYESIKILKERSDEVTASDRINLEHRIRAALEEEYRRSLPPGLRSRTDRLIANLYSLLDESTSHEMAISMSAHRLRARRKAALSIIRRQGVQQRDIPSICAAWDHYKDPDALFALIKTTNGLSTYDCCSLLNNDKRIGDWDAGYLHAVILERLARDGKLNHKHAASNHSIPYLRASGRLSDPELAPLLIPIIEKLEDPDQFKLAASVAGRMRRPELISAIETRLASFQRG